MWWLVVLTTLGAPHTGLPRAAFALLLAAEAAIFGLAFQAYRSAVILDDQGITVRDMFRRRRFEWRQIDAIVVDTMGAIPGPVASIRLRDGSKVRTPLWSGGLGFGNRRTREAIEALAAGVRARRAAAEASLD